MTQNDTVTVTRAPLRLPTYPVGEPERNPLFFEKRVYQGSCGKVYPVPFVDKVGDRARKRAYDAVTLENAWVRVTVLPELGGRIYLGQDKANHDYDFFYRNDVIKPALVGLAGPWVSGGVEFNWPQHHRPGTFMPTDVHIERGEDGSATVWMSEHDPLNRLRGTHGVCLRPGSAAIELKVRLVNRTERTQTFLWWANVAARVHDRYESFFPEDVHDVADHAVRAMTDFPLAHGRYYGVDYGARRGHNDLRRYRDIPVPTSYMVCHTDFDFFGGYDHDAGGGFVHVADRFIAPGKKQWTWGNHAFGHAWDRELTDANGPYVELMAGVYTDNQPDFSYLRPYETRTFSQFWWPYQALGPVQNANRRAALRFVRRNGKLEVGAAVPEALHGARLTLWQAGKPVYRLTLNLDPGTPWRDTFNLAADAVSLEDAAGRTVLAYTPPPAKESAPRRAMATEPPAPEAIASADELFLTAEHLEQNRHPTRAPEAYLEELLRRDPGDARANIMMGRRLYARGCFPQAAEHLDRAIARLTFRHPNPYTGEAHYCLGLVRFRQEREAEAYAAFYKAAWDAAWCAPAYYALACIDFRRGDTEKALAHCDASLDADRRNGKAITLRAIALRALGHEAEAEAALRAHLAKDPLDHWARWESGDRKGFLALTRNDAQTVLDVAYDYAEAGAYAAAIDLLCAHLNAPIPDCPVPNPLAHTPLARYALAWLRERHLPGSGAADLALARRASPDWFFPSRLWDMIVLRWAYYRPGDDRNAAYGLGNLYYDRGRREEAMACWEAAAKADPAFPTALRNLGLATWNVRGDGDAALRWYRKAMKAAPEDARIAVEYDQLCEKAGVPAAKRLTFLLRHRALVTSRDDGAVRLATLLNAANRPQDALDLILARRFHPWEGGEGKVLRQYTEAHLILGRRALAEGDAKAALRHATLAFDTPAGLGEAYHPLQAKADVLFLKGEALRALGREVDARAAFREAADEEGDFVSMAVARHSPLSYWRGRALAALGEVEAARALFASMRRYAETRLGTPAKIDYFATSLPRLLVFDEDLEATKNAEARALIALADAGERSLNEAGGAAACAHVVACAQA